VGKKKCFGKDLKKASYRLKGEQRRDKRDHRGGRKGKKERGRDVLDQSLNRGPGPRKGVVDLYECGIRVKEDPPGAKDLIQERTNNSPRSCSGRVRKEKKNKGQITQEKEVSD